LFEPEVVLERLVSAKQPWPSASTSGRRREWRTSAQFGNAKGQDAPDGWFGSDIAR